MCRVWPCISLFLMFTFFVSCKGGADGRDEQKPERKILIERDGDGKSPLPSVRDFFMNPAFGLLITESGTLIPFGDTKYKQSLSLMRIKSDPETEPTFDVTNGVKVKAVSANCVVLDQDLKSKDGTITLNPFNVICRKTLLGAPFELINPVDTKPFKVAAINDYINGKVAITTDNRLVTIPHDAKYDKKGIAHDGSRTNIDYASLALKGPIRLADKTICAVAKEDSLNFKADSLVCIGEEKNRFGRAWGFCGDVPIADHTFGIDFHACLLKTGELTVRGLKLDLTKAIEAGSGAEIDVSAKKFLALFADEVWPYLGLIINAPGSEEHGRLVFVNDDGPFANFNDIAPLVKLIDPALRFKKIAFGSRRKGSEQPFTFCGITMDNAITCTSQESDSPVVADLPKSVKHYE